jgi:hypothetical protein
MIGYSDIWQAAERLVRLHGDEAPARASMHAHELLEAGEVERRLVWLRIMRASEALLHRDSMVA